MVFTKQLKVGKGGILGNRMEGITGALLICPVVAEDRD